jgi:hypothetical protein
MKRYSQSSVKFFGLTKRCLNRLLDNSGRMRFIVASVPVLVPLPAVTETR